MAEDTTEIHDAPFLVDSNACDATGRIVCLVVRFEDA